MLPHYVFKYVVYLYTAYLIDPSFTTSFFFIPNTEKLDLLCILALVISAFLSDN